LTGGRDIPVAMPTFRSLSAVAERFGGFRIGPAVKVLRPFGSGFRYREKPIRFAELGWGPVEPLYEQGSMRQLLSEKP
jgi:hypothetical protein